MFADGSFWDQKGQLDNSVIELYIYHAYVSGPWFKGPHVWEQRR